MGQFFRIMRDASGDPQRCWIEEVPNDGLIRYRHAFNRERVLPATPKALGEVLVTKNYDFIKPPEFKVGLGRILGIGILLAEGEEHKVKPAQYSALVYYKYLTYRQKQRRHLMPAFSFRHIKDLYPTFWTKSRELVETLKETVGHYDKDQAKMSSAIDVDAWVGRATLDIIGVAGLGKDFGALASPDNELNRTYRSIFKINRTARILGLISIFVPLRLLRLLPLKRNDDMAAASKYIRSFCHDLIQEKKKILGEDVDILSVALRSGGFTDENLVDQLMTFLAAGHETTASSMIWAIYALCKHPEMQKRLREEVRSKLPSLNNTEAEISAADIDGLPYLHAVCNEVLRLYPPVGLTLRKAAKDTTIVGHFIPKDTTIILSPRAINLSKKLWGDDALDFNPERWLAPGQANSGGADSNYSFMTFLHGPRGCIGQAFAKAEFACLLAAWIGSFETELEDPNYIADSQGSGGPTMKPKGGLPVILKPLEGW